MIPLRFVFRSRWAALFWAGGIIWSAVGFAGGTGRHLGGATDDANASIDATNAITGS